MSAATLVENMAVFLSRPILKAMKVPVSCNVANSFSLWLPNSRNRVTIPIYGLITGTYSPTLVQIPPPKKKTGCQFQIEINQLSAHTQ
jgi:hypothetical protein